MTAPNPHPVAAMLPPADGNYYMGISKGDVAEVVPSLLPGFFWVATMAHVIGKPVRADAVSVVLEFLNFDWAHALWSKQPAAPSESINGLRLIDEGGKEEAESLVYFLRSGPMGPIKIGSSADVPTRVKELQTGNPCLLEIVGTLPGGARAERELHARFSHLRIRGEWFTPSDELLAFVSGARR